MWLKNLYNEFSTHNSKCRLTMMRILQLGLFAIFLMVGSLGQSQIPQKRVPNISPVDIQSNRLRKIGEPQMLRSTQTTKFELRTVLVQTWNGSAWVNWYTSDYTYNTGGKKIQELSRDWAGTQWVNSQQYNFTYDVNGNMTNQLNQYWSDTAWINLYQYILTYDSMDNNISTLVQRWNLGEWENDEQDSSVYNSQNKEISELHQFWSGFAWVNNLKDSISYDDQGQEIELLQEELSDSSFYRELFAYDLGGNDTNLLFQSWNGSAWLNASQEIRTFVGGIETNDLRQNWINSWMNIIQDSYSYDLNGNLSMDLEQQWSGGMWMNTTLTTETYQVATGIRDEPNLPVQYNLFANYPNPFNPSTMIAYDVPRRSNVQLSVYDVLGRKVATLVDDVQEPGSHHVQFNASNLSSGIYFYELRAGGISLHRKMVLLR